MEPSKQTLDFPTTTVSAQSAAVLSDGPTPVPTVRRDQFHLEMLAHPLIQRIAVVSSIADQSLRDFAEEAALEHQGSTSVASCGEALANKAPTKKTFVQA